VLAMFRQGWQAMAAHSWHCSWEFSEVGDGHSKAHSYGMFPGCFLSSHVLGVRRVGPATDRQILIEPHLGDLHEAEGVVVTEFGPVPISWHQAEGELHFQGTIPANTKARLSLPAASGLDEILLNGKSLRGVPTGKRLSLDLKPGNFSGVQCLSQPSSVHLLHTDRIEPLSRQKSPSIVEQGLNFFLHRNESTARETGKKLI
jgi:hypothetical protein